MIKEKLQGECDRLQGLVGGSLKKNHGNESKKKEAATPLPKVADHQSIVERIAKSFAALDDSKEADDTMPKVLLFHERGLSSQLQPTVCCKAPPAAVSSSTPTEVSVADRQGDMETTSKYRPNTVQDAGRKIVLDNIDYHQHTHDMTVDNKDADLHYCSYM